jgi:hypothetical protein
MEEREWAEEQIREAEDAPLRLRNEWAEEQMREAGGA